MEADLLGAEPLAHALDQPAYDERDQDPQIEGQQQDDQQTDVDPFGSDGGPIETGNGRLGQRASQLIHRTSPLLLLVGTGVTQLAWMALLAFGAYWIWQRLPF